MADQNFDGIALAIGKQSAFNTVNGTIKALSGALVVSNGIILGDKTQGQAETGITFPNLKQFVREVPQVVGSFTQSADFFLRELAEGLSISFPLKGNGALGGTPTAGAAKPDIGIVDLYGTAGLVGANGSAPVYAFTPRSTIEYSTVKIWVADLAFVLMDCIVDVLEFTFSPGDSALVTASFKVGAVESYTDDVAFPTFTWGEQSALAPPPVQAVNHSAFGIVRGFEDMKITITNGVAEYSDSNATAGVRQSQVDRVITVDGRLYVDNSNSDAEHTNLVNTVAPTADLSFQLGTVTGASPDTCNAVKVEVNNLQAKDIKYDRTGSALVVELSGAKATGLTAGSEFALTYN